MENNVSGVISGVIMENNASGVISGVIFGIVALVVVGVVIYIVSKTKPQSNQSKEFDDEMEKARYQGHKNTIEKAIRENDFAYLEEAKDTRIRDFPDLIAMIEEALQKKPKV